MESAVQGETVSHYPLNMEYWIDQKLVSPGAMEGTVQPSPQNWDFQLFFQTTFGTAAMKFRFICFKQIKSWHSSSTASLQPQ